MRHQPELYVFTSMIIPACAVGRYYYRIVFQFKIHYIHMNIFMNYYKLFKYFPVNLGCKFCLSYRNLLTLYKLLVQLLQILAIQLIWV